MKNEVRLGFELELSAKTLMGAQDTLLKPAIADLIAVGRRSTAFGVFDTSFGAAWFVGSVALGLLYGKSED